MSKFLRDSETSETTTERAIISHVFLTFNNIILIITTHTHTHLGSHSADGGHVIASADEVGCVMLQLELTQPLVDGLGVLTRERDISEATLTHTRK